MTVDFAQLRTLIAAAARQAFTELRAAHAAEDFYAFALYTDDGAMTVEPAANSEQALQRIAAEQNEDADGYLRWSIAEWAYADTGGDYFNHVYDVINVPDRYDASVRGAFRAFRTSLLDAMAGALEDLDAEGFFATNTPREQITLFCSISDSEHAERVEKQTARRLNSRAVYRQFVDSQEA